MDKRVEDWPDLLLIDGGETHLAIIAKLLEEHGVRDRMELASLAKRGNNSQKVMKISFLTAEVKF